jgi:radical SAM superfamily enzyme
MRGTSYHTPASGVNLTDRQIIEKALRRISIFTVRNKYDPRKPLALPCALEIAWSMQRQFLHPEPTMRRVRLVPLFMPHAGCPGACIYCAQEIQTGAQRLTMEDLALALLELLRRQPPQRRFELAFFGGTFTALPRECQHKLLRLAGEWKREGRITRIRCSTRPDAFDPDQLDELRCLGLDMIELGIQSFAPGALAASRRGYTPEQALRACAMVRSAGLDLGIQLLPGLPGQTQADFRADIAFCRTLNPELVRLYPLLVLRNTVLEGLWRRGDYHPWGLRRCVETLACALLQLWDSGIRVARMGVAQEPGLAEQVLAGPWHPALGARARGAALFRIVRGELLALGRAPRRLRIPRRYQGEFWGHRGEWASAYARLGLERAMVGVWEESGRERFLLE